MNPERPQSPSENEEVHDNDNTFESGMQEQRELFDVLGRTLAPEVMQRVNALALVDTWSAFEDEVRALNELSKREQLNYADPKVASELEAEKLASRQMEGTLNFTRGWKLGVSRAMNGTYTFEAKAS